MAQDLFDSVKESGKKPEKETGTTKEESLPLLGIFAEYLGVTPKETFSLEPDPATHFPRGSIFLTSQERLLRKAGLCPESPEVYSQPLFDARINERLAHPPRAPESRHLPLVRPPLIGASGGRARKGRILPTGLKRLIWEHLVDLSRLNLPFEEYVQQRARDIAHVRDVVVRAYEEELKFAKDNPRPNVKERWSEEAKSRAAETIQRLDAIGEIREQAIKTYHVDPLDMVIWDSEDAHYLLDPPEKVSLGDNEFDWMFPVQSGRAMLRENYLLPIPTGDIDRRTAKKKTFVAYSIPISLGDFTGLLHEAGLVSEHEMTPFTSALFNRPVWEATKVAYNVMDGDAEEAD
ncbi:MAG: hypothetical protein JSW08_01565 [archaeon]|nr:MAG: hypothetical protein JSW08_01565 [archaeon]